MKVLVLSHMYPNKVDPVFGIFVHEQVKALIKNGCEITVVNPIPYAIPLISLFKREWNIRKNIPKFEIIDGVKIYHPRFISFSNFTKYQNRVFLYHGIKKIVHKLYNNHNFDLIHAHTPVMSGYSAERFSRELNVPFIVTNHGSDITERLNKRPYQKEIRRILKRASQIVNVSNKLTYICGNNSLKAITINNGLDSKMISNKKKKTDKIVILGVGHLIKTKGFDISLKALNKLNYKNFMYYIVGQGCEEDNLKKLTKKLDIEDKVRFVGEVPHNIVMDYMSMCDIFILPSWREGFGVVYIEAMAHAKPVIGVKGQGVEDAIINWQNGVLVELKDVDSVKKTLEKLIKDKKLRQSIGKNAKKTVLEDFTWDINAKKYIKVYVEIIKNKSDELK